MVRTRPDRKIAHFTAEEMKAAVDKVILEGKSIRIASDESGIKKATLHRYVQKVNKGTIERYEPHYNVHSVFTKEQENNISEYLVKAAAMCYGLTPMRCRMLAYQYAMAIGIDCPQSWSANKAAGPDWFAAFLKRHPHLSLRRPEATSLSRATSFNRHNVGFFFTNLDDVMKRYKFSAADIYNLDETGCKTVQDMAKVKVIAPKQEKQVGKVTSAERGTLVSLLCCVNACGNSIPPLFVFPRVHFKEHMLHGAPPGSVGVAHPSGWMTGENFVVFLHHFINNVRCSKDHLVLIIMDNHDSHITIDALNVAKENGIILLTFPPHCSHKLQPLDRTIFGPFKHYYTQAANGYMNNHPGCTISIHNIAELVGKAYLGAFTPRNITAGFKVSGIFPFDSNIFNDEEFAPSSVTDREDPSDVCPAAPDDREDASDVRPGGSGGRATVPAGVGPTASTSAVSIDTVSPLPKVPPRKTTGGRKKGKTQILTDTPVKQAIEADILKRGCKNDKGSENGRFAKGKRKLQTDGESVSKVSRPKLDSMEHGEHEDDDVEEDLCLPKLTLGHSECLKKDDFALVRFQTEKNREIHYIGQVQESIIVEDDVEYEIMFMRCSIKRSYIFKFPNIDDVADVEAKDIVAVLPEPVEQSGRYLRFQVDLSPFNKSLA